jgi:hypothetical protein
MITHFKTFDTKTYVYLILVILFSLLSFVANGQYRKLENTAFDKGERLVYRVHYGFVDAGFAEIEVKNEDKIVAGRKVFHCVGNGYSRGAFDWFFKVRDRYETYIDQDGIEPVMFFRRVDEGGYKISQNYIYNHSNNMVQADGKSFKVAAHMQDMLSAFYYARTIDFSAAKKNDIYTIPAFVDNEVFNLKIKFVGREIINTDHGNIYCMKFRPILQKGRIFKHEEDLNVWISDDDNHIPIRAQAEILVGSIKMDLHQFSGTKSKLRFN